MTDEEIPITLYLGEEDRAPRRTSRWLLVVQPEMAAPDAAEHRRTDPGNSVVGNEEGAQPAEIQTPKGGHASPFNEGPAEYSTPEVKLTEISARKKEQDIDMHPVAEDQHAAEPVNPNKSEDSAVVEEWKDAQVRSEDSHLVKPSDIDTEKQDMEMTTPEDCSSDVEGGYDAAIKDCAERIGGISKGNHEDVMSEEVEADVEMTESRPLDADKPADETADDGAIGGTMQDNTAVETTEDRADADVDMTAPGSHSEDSCRHDQVEEMTVEPVEEEVAKDKDVSVEPSRDITADSTAMQLYKPTADVALQVGTPQAQEEISTDNTAVELHKPTEDATLQLGLRRIDDERAAEICELIEDGRLQLELIAALSTTRPEPFVSTAFVENAPHPMASVPALGQIGIPFNTSIFSSAATGTLPSASSAGSISLGTASFGNRKYQAWVEKTAKELAAKTLNVEDVECTLSDTVVFLPDSVVTGIHPGIPSSQANRSFGSMVVFPPTASGFSLSINNPNTNETKSVLGGTAETAGATVVAAWLSGAQQCVKTESVPALAFVYSLHVKDRDRTVPTLQAKPMDAVKRTRELLEGWCRWQDARDEAEDLGVPRTIVWYDSTCDEVSETEKRTLLSAAEQLGLVIHKTTLLVERIGVEGEYETHASGSAVVKSGDTWVEVESEGYESIDPNTAKVHLSFQQDRNEDPHKGAHGYFDSVEKIDTSTHTAFSPDLIIPTSAPNLHEDWDLEHCWLNGLGQLKHTWEADAFILCTKKRYAATASRLFGVTAARLLDSRFRPEGSSDDARKAFLRQMVQYLRPDAPGTVKPGSGKGPREAALGYLCAEALALDDRALVKQIVDKWGLPDDPFDAGKLLRVLKHDVDSPEDLARYCYGSSEQAPLPLASEMEFWETALDGDKEMIERVVKMFLRFRPHAFSEEELELVASRLGSEFLVENERQLSYGHDYADQKHWLTFLSLCPDAYDVGPNFDRVVFAHKPQITEIGLSPSTVDILKFCILPKTKQLSLLPSILEKVAKITNVAPEQWKSVLHQILQTFQNAELPMSAHLTAQQFVIATLRVHILPTVPPRPISNPDAAPNVSLPPLPNCLPDSQKCGLCNLITLFLTHGTSFSFDVATNKDQLTHLYSQLNFYLARTKLHLEPTPPPPLYPSFTRLTKVNIDTSPLEWEKSRAAAEAIIDTFTDRDLGHLVTLVRASVSPQCAGFGPPERKLVDAWLQKAGSDILKLRDDEHELERQKPLREAVAKEMMDSVYREWMVLHTKLEAEAPKAEAPKAEVSKTEVPKAEVPKPLPQAPPAVTSAEERKPELPPAVPQPAGPSDRTIQDEQRLFAPPTRRVMTTYAKRRSSTQRPPSSTQPSPSRPPPSSQPARTRDRRPSSSRPPPSTQPPRQKRPLDPSSANALPPSSQGKKRRSVLPQNIIDLSD